jgi:Zn-dependent protease
VNRTERNDLLLSWATLCVAFALVFANPLESITKFLFTLPIAVLAVSTAFILHELAHRNVARYYGAHAEYRAWQTGLIFTLLLPLITLPLGKPFLFALTGAVYIYDPYISRSQSGKIALAGPAANIVLGIVFIVLAFFIQDVASMLVGPFIIVGFINLWLALFNLLPVPPLDGSKVFAWNPLIWALSFIPLAMFFIPRLAS